MEMHLPIKKIKMGEPSPANLFEIPEILAIVLKSLDTERLKLYRGVCLTWCNEISRILRKRVVPRYAHYDWSKFQELLDSGKGQERLSCPFQEMYALLWKESLGPSPRIRAFFDWLHPPSPLTRLTLIFTEGNGDQVTPISHLSYYEERGTDLQRCVWVLLQSCSATLTHLQTPFWALKEEQVLELGLASLHFPQLRALKAVGLKYYNQPYPKAQELDFFLRIIASAPNLKALELKAAPSARLILGRANLKSLEKLRVTDLEDYNYVWPALNEVNSEGLKSIYITDKLRGEENEFFHRFSSSLEHYGLDCGPWEIPGCPFLTHLDFEVSQNPLDLGAFPSLSRVTVRGESLRNALIQGSSRTVTDVDIENFCVSEAAETGAVLEGLFKRFPCATHWKINCQTLQEFCQVASRERFPIEKLGLSLRCFWNSPCIRSSSNAKVNAAIDLELFSCLSLLQNLRELELYQRLEAHTCGLPETIKKLPYNVSKIPYGRLPNFRTLRIYAKSHELPNDLIQLQDLTIAVEAIVDPCPRSPNWSNPLLSMRNLTFRVVTTEFPVENYRFGWD